MPEDRVGRHQSGADDDLIAVLLTDGRQEVIIGTEEGMFIRFPEMDVRRWAGARGVKAITLTLA